MAWTNSKVFQRHLTNMIGNVLAIDFDADVYKAALYNNSITPDNDVATDPLHSYNGAASQWVTGNEVIDTTGGASWPAGGITLTSKSVDVSAADFVKVTAANTPSADNTADIANAFGTLVYNNTLTDKVGMCYNYFGGANSVTNGTFTIVWHTNGIVRYTL